MVLRLMNHTAGELWWISLNTARRRYNAVNFHPNPRKIHSIARPPVRAKYGLSSMNITSVAQFASVIVVPYVKTCYVVPRYNGTRVYRAYNTSNKRGAAFSNKKPLD